MIQKLSSEWLWQFSAKARILGLHQADLGLDVGVFDEEGGVYAVDAQGGLKLELGFKSPVRAVRIVREGQQVVVLDHGGALQAFDMHGKSLFKIAVDETALSMDARSVAQLTAVGCSNGLLTLWSGRGQKIRSLYLSHAIDYLKFAYDCGYLIAASAHGEISYIDHLGKFVWKLDIGTACGGIDVDGDAGLIVMNAYSEGIYAFNRNRETLGAYDIGAPVLAAALSQKGGRVLAASEHRLHVLRRDGTLEAFVDLPSPPVRMDLNYTGDIVTMQLGSQEIKTLQFVSPDSPQSLAVEMAPKKRPVLPSLEAQWSSTLSSGKTGQLRMTARGSFAVCLTDDFQLIVWDGAGNLLWREVLEPEEPSRLYVSRFSNTILVHTPRWVDYFTAAQGRIKRFETRAQRVAVHDGGLLFAIVNEHFDLGLFGKRGEFLWSQRLEKTPDDVKINPLGNAVFVAMPDGRLRAFRQEGRLGWERAIHPVTGEVVLGDDNVDAHQGVVQACDGYEFRSADVGHGRFFVFDRGGITLTTGDFEVARLDGRGEILWSVRLSEPIVALEGLRDHVIVRGKSGRDYIFHLRDKLIHSFDPAPGLRQVAVLRSGTLAVFECMGRELICKEAATDDVIFRHQAAGAITQFTVEASGENLLYLAQGVVVGLSLAAKHTSVSDTVAFLEI